MCECCGGHGHKNDPDHKHDHKHDKNAPKPVITLIEPKEKKAKDK